MDPIGTGAELTFSDYLRPLWRFKFVVLVVVVLAAAGTYLYTNRETKTYQASTEIYVGPSTLQQILNPTSNGLSATAVANDANFVTVPSVADRVRANLKLPYSPSALLSAVTATPASTSSDFLVITAQTSNPQLAAELANGFAQGYLQMTQANLVNGARSEVKAEEHQLKHLTPGPTNSDVRTAIATQIATLEGIITGPPSVGTKENPAGVPTAATSPDPKRNAIFAGAIALVLGIILSYLLDRGDRRIRSLGELEPLFEVPVLAAVPHVRRAEPTRKDPAGIPAPLRESHRTLRVNLDIARGLGDPKVILVTSALPGEGKSTIVRNLAITYREAGARVAIIEADLRRPVLAAQLGVDPGPGLSETLHGDAEPHMQRVPDGAEQLNGGGGRLDVLVAGIDPTDPTVLLTDERMRHLIARVAAAYDLVLVDSPPALVVSDALALLAVVDGLIIVARAGTITYRAASRLRRTVERVSRVNRVHLIGAVVNDIADEFTYYGRPGRKPRREGAPVPADHTPERVRL